MIPSTDYFISTNMERGVKWLQIISAGLDTHSLGIVCVTPGNVEKPWINFEAGALSKHLGDEGRVIPYLLDFKSLSDLRDPLAQFNACQTTEEGTWQLVQTLNAHSEFKHDDVTMREIFDVWWPKLGPRLEQIRVSGSQPPERRDPGEKIDELLATVRSIRSMMVHGPRSERSRVRDEGERRKVIHQYVRSFLSEDNFDELEIFDMVVDVEALLQTPVRPTRETIERTARQIVSERSVRRRRSVDDERRSNISQVNWETDGRLGEGEN